MAKRTIDLSSDAERAADLGRMGRGLDALRPSPPPDQVSSVGRRRRRRRKLPPRATYYLPPEVQERVREMAAYWDVPQSDVVRLALERLGAHWDEGELASVEPQLVLGHAKLSLYPDE